MAIVRDENGVIDITRLNSRDRKILEHHQRLGVPVDDTEEAQRQKLENAQNSPEYRRDKAHAAETLRRWGMDPDDPRPEGRDAARHWDIANGHQFGTETKRIFGMAPVEMKKARRKWGNNGGGSFELTWADALELLYSYISIKWIKHVFFD